MASYSNGSRSPLATILLLILLVAIIWLGWPLVQDQLTPPLDTLGEVAGNEPLAGKGAAVATDVSPLNAFETTHISFGEGLIILAIREGLDSHIFVYHPQSLNFTRLTFGEWDDIDPVVNPTNTHIAFASNRDGYWDLYQLELETGNIIRITDTPE